MDRRRNAVKHVGIYSAGAMIRQFVGFLMLPIYTRYLTPADYGIVAMLTLLLSVFELVLGARFAAAIPKFYYEHDNERDRGTVVGTALAVTMAASALGALIIAGASRPLAEIFLADTELWAYVALFGITLVTVAIENYALVYIRMRDKPVLFVAVSLIKLVVVLTLNILLVVVLQWGVLGAVVSTVSSSIAFGLVLGIYTLVNTGGWRISRTLIRRLLRFSWPLWVASVAAVYISFANRFLIRYFGDLAEVGLYDLAARFSSLLLILVWQPFNQWWQTERFVVIRRDDNGGPVFRSIFSLVAAALSLFAFGISVFSELVIRVMADAAFHTSALAVAPLSFAVAMQQMALFQNVSFLASEKTYWVAYLKYGSAAILTVLYITMIPILGYLGAAYATLGAALIMLMVTTLTAKRVKDLTITLVPAFWFLVIGVVAVGYDTIFLSGLSIVIGGLAKSALTLVVLAAFIGVLWTDASTRVDTGRLFRAVRQKLGR